MLVSSLSSRAAPHSRMHQSRPASAVPDWNVLPIENSTLNSSEWMASQAMTAFLQDIKSQDIKRNYSSHVVILDMPPMLLSDEVITLLPQIDCVLLVAASGLTTTSEISECNRHLQSANVVRLVLNKVPRIAHQYYYGS